MYYQNFEPNDLAQCDFSINTLLWLFHDYPNQVQLPTVLRLGIQEFYRSRSTLARSGSHSLICIGCRGFAFISVLLMGSCLKEDRSLIGS